MNGRPLSNRKKFQILILLTLLVWATQTLLHQWGYGAEIPLPPAAPAAPFAPSAPLLPAAIANGPASVDAAAAGEEAGAEKPAADVENAATNVEKFVPAGGRATGGTLELREEANVYGGEARLKQLCRWTEADAAVFLPVADLVLVRMDADTRFKSVALPELKTTLREAGVNLAVVHFSGATRCTIRRTDAQVKDESLTLDQWITARHGDAPTPAPAKPAPAAPVAVAAAAPIPASAPATRPAAVAAERPAVRSLRSLLVDDLAVRINLPADELEVSFNPRDENLLNLSEPQFRFNLDARRVRNLGEVEWEVTVVAGNAARKAPVLATARAWQSQVVVNKPLAYRQLIRDTDVTERRALVDRVGEDPLLALPQAVGQQAARDLKPGTVLTGRMVDPVPLAKPGQLITVITRQGNIRVKTVARALEAGSFGQTVHVKNDATNEFYDVVLTGPQEGAVGAAPAAPGAAEAKLAAAKD